MKTKITTSVPQLVGKPDYTISAEYKGAISVWRREGGWEVDSGDNVTAMALQDIDANKFVSLAYGELRDDSGRLVYEGWLAQAWEA